jgi:Peptidase A4 family
MRFQPFLNLVSAFAVPIVGIAMMPLAGAAMAQSPTAAPVGISPTAAGIYNSSHTIKTNVPGVTGFPDLPPGFDAVSASAEQRAAYGLPPAPPATDPASYATWKKAMSHIGHARQYTGPLTVTKMKSMPMKAVGKPTASADGTISSSSYNWSGVASTTAATAWNATNSFYYVVSEFNVPVAQEAFGYCDGTYDIEVSWNGIDGYSNGDVLQGGSLSQAICMSGVTSPLYYAWVEWYPSYDIIEEYAVNPGDDIVVVTYATSPMNGYVFVQDLTLNIYKTVNLVPTEPPYLVGSSAEYIVERPYGSGSGLGYYPLANYISNFWASSYAYTTSATLRTPGQTNTKTSLITMVADDGTPISYPAEVGPPYQIWLSDENCAYSGGCTP